MSGYNYEKLKEDYIAFLNGHGRVSHIDRFLQYDEYSRKLVLDTYWETKEALSLQSKRIDALNEFKQMVDAARTTDECVLLTAALQNLLLRIGFSMDCPLQTELGTFNDYFLSNKHVGVGSHVAKNMLKTIIDSAIIENKTF